MDVWVLDPSRSLSPWLDDIRNIIESGGLGEGLSCLAADGQLTICDETTIPLAIDATTTDPLKDSVGILLTIAAGPAVSENDKGFAEFHNAIMELCNKYHLIPRWESRNGYRRYGFAVRLAWTKNMTSLGKSLEHCLGVLRRFYNESEARLLEIYQVNKITILADELFEMRRR